jgi:tetratricopeptide (TPR) repeat protein
MKIFLSMLLVLSMSLAACAEDKPEAPLTDQAWKALGDGDYGKVIALADKCVNTQIEEARSQQGLLTEFPAKDAINSYKALNDVATCLFIKGDAYLKLGNEEQAKKMYNKIINEFSFAQCWDPRGWYWKVAESARDRLTSVQEKIDFGDYFSDNLVRKAWDAFSAKEYRKAEIYAKKCVSLYEDTARLQQKDLTSFPSETLVKKYWALNDVALAYLVLGKAQYDQKNLEEAKVLLKKVIADFPFAQATDPRGWTWQIASAAKDQLTIIESRVDFGDYGSETLTTRAWVSLNSGDYDGATLYAQKCIQLYSNLAAEMQASLKEFAPADKAFNFWALNDVGTCYYILGEIWAVKGNYNMAMNHYVLLTEKYNLAQCWDPRGWFWKPAEVAKAKMQKMQAQLDAVTNKK